MTFLTITLVHALRMHVHAQLRHVDARFTPVELAQVDLQTYTMSRGEGRLNLATCLPGGVQWRAGVSAECFERLFGKARKMLVDMRACHIDHVMAALHVMHVQCESCHGVLHACMVRPLSLKPAMFSEQASTLAASWANEPGVRALGAKHSLLVLTRAKLKRSPLAGLIMHIHASTHVSTQILKATSAATTW